MRKVVLAVASIALATGLVLADQSAAANPAINLLTVQIPDYSVGIPV